MSRLMIEHLENLTVSSLGKEVHVELKTDLPHITQVAVLAEEKVSPRYGKYIKHTYRLNGDRISRMAADLILRAYDRIER